MLRATRRKLPGARVSPSSARQEIVHIDEAGRASPDLTAVKTVNSKPSFVLVHAGEACSASASNYTRRPSVPLRGRLDSHSWTSCSIHRTLPACPLAAGVERVPRRSAHRCWTGTTRSRRPLPSVSPISSSRLAPPRAPCGARGRKSSDPGSSDGIREPNDAALGGRNAVGGLGRARRSERAGDRLYQVSPRRHSHRNRRAVVVGGPTALIVSITRSICHPLRTPLAAAVSLGR